MGKRAINTVVKNGEMYHELDGSPSSVVASQTGLRCFAWKATFNGIIVDVQAYAKAITGSVQFDVQNNALVSVLTGLISVVADTVVQGTLVNTAATKRFNKGDIISVFYTTNGAGGATNPSIVITVRPFPMDGEAAVGP